MLRVCSILTALAVSASPLLAQTQLTAEDSTRLERFDATAGAALLHAFAAGTPEDTEALRIALSGAPLVAFDPSLNGAWTCRTLKLGGDAALSIFRPFSCSITLLLNGAVFEKTTGSERTKGRIEYRAGRAIYAGVGYSGDQEVPAYSDLIAEDGFTSQVAVFERISPTRARLMFPSPGPEADLSILELTR